MNNLQRPAIKYILILISTLCFNVLQAEELSKDEHPYLNVAKSQLNIAFDNYNKGDITAAKDNLKHASEWLYKAVNHSRSDKVNNEVQLLASDIDKFRTTLSKSSDQNDIARYWHQATSLITRESEHLIHSYTESSNNSKNFTTSTRRKISLSYC